MWEPVGLTNVRLLLCSTILIKQGPLRSGVASLRVSGNYLSMAGALNLAFALRGGALPGLRTLDVSSNGIYGQVG
jgi:hypothetical protein